MKKITIILFIALTAIITSCEGPMGPPGIPGEPGLPGEALIGTVFEKNGDFNSGNGHTLSFTFPSEFIIYDTDIVLVYRLSGVVDNMDVWTLLPQTILYEEGIIQYNFDHTVADVEIFMDGTIPVEKWLPVETQNQIFRIAVLPAGTMANKSVDLTDFGSLQSLPNLKLNTIRETNNPKLAE